VSFNPFSAEWFADPTEPYRTLRDEAPLYRNDELDFYALSRFDDVVAALRDWQTFASGSGISLSELSDPDFDNTGNMLSMDPPEHDALHSVVPPSAVDGAACGCGAADGGEAEPPHVVAQAIDVDARVGEGVVVEHGHHELGDEPRVGRARCERARGAGRFELAGDELGEGLDGCAHRVGEQLLQPPVLRGHEARTARLVVAGEGGERLGDVEVEAVDRIVERRRLGQELLAMPGDEVGDDRDDELVLAAEVPVEGLEGDVGLLDQILRREVDTPFEDQAMRSGADGVGVGLSPGAGAACRALRRAHDATGVRITTGISRSVRDWYFS
jgi:hypothetical protein